MANPYGTNYFKTVSLTEVADEISLKGVSSVEGQDITN